MNAAAPAVPIPHKVSALLTCILAALAGLMFGLDIGVISGATQFIQAEFGVSDHTIEWIVSAMMFGAAVGAAFAGWLSVRLGRKRSLILGAALFVVGSLLCGGAWSPDTLIAARFILGLAIGIAAFTAPAATPSRIITPALVHGCTFSIDATRATIVPSPVSGCRAN